jgi:phospholipase C
MGIERLVPRLWCGTWLGLSFLAAMNFAVGIPLARAGVELSTSHNDKNTRTPIKHVIVIIGENRTFDHIFATYVPRKGQTVKNLLSEGIIKADGSPGPHFSNAHQKSACDLGVGATCPNSGQASTTGDPYLINPADKKLYPVLPPPLAGGPTNVCKDNGICTLAEAIASENGLATGYYQYMMTGGTGLKKGTPDIRIENVNDLPPGPFQLTADRHTFKYDAYAASPVHRFYQMWQQLDCDISYATDQNPDGCLADLFSWVETTVGAGTNGLPQPPKFNDQSTGEGSTALGFYNVQQGDASYLTFLANHYSMSDNYHQGVAGGTGANHIMIGFADALWFSDSKGNPEVPPHDTLVYKGTPNAGVVDEIENPDPAAGTNNWYTEDGYGGGGFSSPAYGGGSYSNCSDALQPGVAAIVDLLDLLPNNAKPNCEEGHYYLLNNYNPGYFGDGSNAYTDHNVNNTPFTIPPTSVRNIGDALLEKNVSWKYYGDQWNAYLTDKYQLNYGAVGANSDQYCNICNPFQYATSIMTNAAVRTAHLQDTTDLYNDIQKGTLPAVSFVKPSGWVDGHPASSKLILFEGFVKKIIDLVKKNHELWAHTAILITFDEGGGYYDSGYVQALDYFGDGTRIPMIAVSPFARGGHVSHVYSDHASIAKFIEYNWKIAPLTNRSRDNYPNPQTQPGNPYVPVNSPAIGDLTDLFRFKK